MLMWNPSKLTTAGKALLAKAQAGQTSIKITKAQSWIRFLFFRRKHREQNSSEDSEADLPDSE